MDSHEACYELLAGMPEWMDVYVKPYRTFQEVDQPESPFLIRVSERGISFTEADGGMWKLKARETIKAFLEERLQQEVSEGSVVIAL